MQLEQVLAERAIDERNSGLERHCAVVIAALDRQRLATSEVAAALQMDRSHLAKIRRGERPMPVKLLGELIDYLRLDRVRLVIAAELMGSSDLYFDPMFSNVCYYIQGVLADLIALIDQPGSVDRRLLFASLNRDRCEGLARSANRQIGAHFEALENFTD